LINGIEASDNQIKSIAPTNVVRVEYFDIPPTRFVTRADTVVNIVTRNPEKGYSYGADITSAFITGFVNGSAYGNYTKGKMILDWNILSICVIMITELSIKSTITI
jgi:hypothetical protein